MKIAFFGTPYFAAVQLEHLIKEGYQISVVVTAPDKPAGRGRKINQSAVKEVALKNEIEKLGGKIEITDDSLKLYPSFEIKKNISIKTYNDHRMAMAFAPLSLLVPIYIENPDVVTKSYKNFWSDLRAINFEISR